MAQVLAFPRKPKIAFWLLPPGCKERTQALKDILTALQARQI